MKTKPQIHTVSVLLDGRNHRGAIDARHFSPIMRRLSHPMTREEAKADRARLNCKKKGTL